MNSLLLIDDDFEMSEMLTEYLAREGYSVTAVSHGQEGIAAANSGYFGGVILDIMLPDITGIEVLRKIRSSSTIPVIMLTAKGSEVDCVVALEMGADDYVTKPYHPRELVARIRAVLRRPQTQTPPSNIELSFGDLTLCKLRREAAWREARLELTVTEFNMMELLMRSGKEVATKDDISRAVLGRARESYDRGVDVHISNLRRKLNNASLGNMEIETVRGVGYRLKQQP